MTYELGGGEVHTAKDHVSERKTGAWVDCLPASLVMLARAAGLDIPSTVAEAMALRKQAGYGPNGGTTLEGLAHAFSVRYGLSYHISRDPNPEDIITAGRAAALVGSMSAFGPNHPLSHWDPHFDNYHAVFTAMGPDADAHLWDDPEAPEGIGYAGVLVSEKEMQNYYNAAPFAVREIGWLVSGSVPHIPPVTGGGEAPMVARVAQVFPDGTTAKIAVGTQLRDAGGNAYRKAGSTDTVPCLFGTGTGAYAIVWQGEEVYVRSAGVTPILPPTQDCSTEVAAAIALDRGKAHIVYS